MCKGAGARVQLEMLWMDILRCLFEGIEEMGSKFGGTGFQTEKINLELQKLDYNAEQSSKSGAPR